MRATMNGVTVYQDAKGKVIGVLLNGNPPADSGYEELMVVQANKDEQEACKELY